MKALLYSIWLQWKLDFRNKSMLTSYYVLPIAFYLIVGAIYKEVTPRYEDTMIPAMNVLAVSLAAFLGTPAPVNSFFTSEEKNTYLVGNISLRVILITTFISGFIHIIIVSSGILLTAPMIFDVNISSELGLYILYLIFTIVISLIIGMTIGVLTKNNSSMTMTSQLLFLPTMLLCGIILPTSFLPDILQNFSKVLPATYSILILNSLTEIRSDMIFPLVGIGLFAIITLEIVYRRKLIS